MTVMRWFRRHNKKLLVGIVFVVMLAFGLPQVFFTSSGQTNPAENTIAYISDQKGGQDDITLGMLQLAERDLRALQLMGMAEISMRGGFTQVPGLEGVGMYPILATHMLFFGENRRSLDVRNGLYQRAEQSDWAQDDAKLQELKETIDRLASTESALAPRYFLLLWEEAHRAGIIAAPDQISAVFNMRPYGVRIDVIAKKLRITKEELKAAVGKYLAILLSGDMFTEPLALSELELKKNIRDQIEKENVTGSFVTFAADLFRDQVGDPTDEILRKQFETYKKYQPGKFDDDNPFGLGYFLGDRVQVEFLKVDLTQVQKSVEDEFNQLTVSERETCVKTFWSNHKEMFRERIDTPVADNTQPQYRFLDFDEVADQAESVWKRQEASTRAEQSLTEAKRISREAWKESPLKELPLQKRTERAVVYANLAQKPKVSTESVTVVAAKTDYLDTEAVQQFEFGSAYRERKNADPRALTNILFDCVPLHKGVVSTLDEPPAELFEDIGPLRVYEGESGPPVAVYLVRIVAVDPAREAVTLADDGRGGPADQAVIDPNTSILHESEIYERAKGEWKMLQAFDLTKIQAEIFTQQTDPNWTAALARTNQSLIKDPNRYPPGQGPLRMENLGDIRQQIDNTRQQRDNYIQFVQKSREQQQLSPYIQYQLAQMVDLIPQMGNQIAQMNNLLQKTMELAQQRRDSGTQEPAILSLEEQLSCYVFENLSVTLPSRQEYLRRKALTALQLVRRNQELMALLHFDPKNIEIRTGFEEKKED